MKDGGRNRDGVTGRTTSDNRGPMGRGRSPEDRESSRVRTNITVSSP